VRFLHKNLRTARRLLTQPTYHPRPLVDQLETLAALNSALGISELHVFTFNQVAAIEPRLRADSDQGGPRCLNPRSLITSRVAM